MLNSFIYLACIYFILSIIRFFYFFFKDFLGLKQEVLFMSDVSIYSETILPIKDTMIKFFGEASNPIVYDIGILVGWIVLLVFCYCIIGLLFKK